ncbi:hypothetical protein JL722_13919 [Aureococcus anophagefferens]|nr:hypothetical protein JL722_13919 [Aureococcus anophagefferens]
MAAVVAAAGAMGDVGAVAPGPRPSPGPRAGTKFVVTASNEVGGGSAKFVLKKWAAVDSTPACSRGVGDELEVVELDGRARTRGPEITLKVMHPEHKDHKVMTVEVYADTPVVDLKATIGAGKEREMPNFKGSDLGSRRSARDGPQEKPLLPVKKYNSGPVDDDHKAMMESRLKDYVNWIPCDAKDTDDLKEDLKWIAPMYSDSDDDDSDHEWTYEKYVAQRLGAGVISDRRRGRRPAATPTSWNSFRRARRRPTSLTSGGAATQAAATAVAASRAARRGAGWRAAQRQRQRGDSNGAREGRGLVAEERRGRGVGAAGGGDEAGVGDEDAGDDEGLRGARPPPEAPAAAAQSAGYAGKNAASRSFA